MNDFIHGFKKPGPVLHAIEPPPEYDEDTPEEKEARRKAWEERTARLSVNPDDIINSLGDHHKPNGLREGAQTRPPPNTYPDISQWCVSRFEGKDPPPLEFAIERIAPKGMVTLLVAEGGVGKTMLKQIAGTAIATGSDFFGLQTMKGAAAGIFAEDPDAVLHIRQTRICTTTGTELSQLRGKWFMLPQGDGPLVLWHDGEPTELLLKLEHDLAKIPDLQLLTLDNVALLYSDNEIERIAVTAFMGYLNRLAARLNIAIILSTHNSKSSDGSTLRLASGSTAWINAARSVIELKRHEDNPDFVSLALRKANHSRIGDIAELVWKDGILVKCEVDSPLVANLKEDHLRNYILEEIEKRQETGSPLAASPNSPMYLPTVLQQPPRFKHKELLQAMRTLMAEGKIEPYQKTTRSPKGLRKCAR